MAPAITVGGELRAGVGRELARLNGRRPHIRLAPASQDQRPRLKSTRTALAEERLGSTFEFGRTQPLLESVQLCFDSSAHP